MPGRVAESRPSSLRAADFRAEDLFGRRCPARTTRRHHPEKAVALTAPDARRLLTTIYYGGSHQRSINNGTWRSRSNDRDRQKLTFADRPPVSLDFYRISKTTVGVRSPLTYFGSKSRLAARILAHFPPHHTYVEPFAGSGACLLSKEPSQVEVLNDINGDIVNLFRVLRSPSQFQRLRAAAEATLYSRSEFELAFRPAKDPVERARRFPVRQRQSRAGLGERWSYCKADSAVKMASVVRRWRAGIDRLPGIHRRLKNRSNRTGRLARNLRTI